MMASITLQATESVRIAVFPDHAHIDNNRAVKPCGNKRQGLSSALRASWHAFRDWWVDPDYRPPVITLDHLAKHYPKTFFTYMGS